MNPRTVASEAAERLRAAGVPDPEFEAEYLVRDAAGLSRAQFFAGYPADDAAMIAGSISRRVEREPAAYITGEREFYGLAFAVGPGVLVPRPETEMLVDLGIEEGRKLVSPVIVDVGTGSGAVSVSLALALAGSGARIVATEVSTAALAVARRNAASLDADLALIRGDLVSALARADIVLANLPYIPSGEIDALEPEVSRWEPRVALDGGPDGYSLIRRLVADCATRLHPRVLALEVGFGQAAEVAALCQGHGAAVELRRDFGGIDRIVVARWE